MRRRARAIALAILAAGAGATPILAEPVLRYEALLQGIPALRRPTCATYDPVTSGLCITEDAERAIGMFDRDGLDRFRTDAQARLSAPIDACVEANGDFVLTDRLEGNRRTIRRLNFLGEPIAWEPERPYDDWSPRHFRLLADGDYLTLDRKGLLAKHDSDTGALLWSTSLVDPTWERADLLGRPEEAPDGSILVPNAGAAGILIVSPAGEPAGSFGFPGGKRGELIFPVGVAITTGGHILVLDRMRHAILLFDSTHRFLNEFGRVGYGPGDLYHPVAIEAAPDGRVWITQGFQGRIQRFRLYDPFELPRPSPSEPGS